MERGRCYYVSGVFMAASVLAISAFFQVITVDLLLSCIQIHCWKHDRRCAKRTYLKYCSLLLQLGAFIDNCYVSILRLSEITLVDLWDLITHRKYPEEAKVIIKKNKTVIHWNITSKGDYFLSGGKILIF